MSLQRTLRGNVLEVKDVELSFHTTKVRYWYYDIAHWLRTRTGKQGEVPSQPMSQPEIDWVRKYHLPRAVTEDT